MTEADAREYVRTKCVSRGTLAYLDKFTDALIVECGRQNLIAASTLNLIWSRHIADSAQLLDHGPSEGMWLDIGSGAGFPGLMIAVIAQRPVTIIEDRAKRISFLKSAAEALAVSDLVDIRKGRAEKLSLRDVSVISARAVAPLDQLFATAVHLSDRSTCWILPKGAGARRELAEARKTWQGRFDLKASVTDEQAAIVVATDIQSRAGR